MNILGKLRAVIVAIQVLLMSSLPVAAQANRAGKVVSSVPVTGAPAGASAYRIRYRSADTFGRPIIVSGAVVIPNGNAPAGGRSVVVWAHGASGIAQACGLSDKPGFFDDCWAPTFAGCRLCGGGARLSGAG